MKIAIALLATLGVIADARAVDWSGLGADSNWSTPGNWVGGAAPSNDDNGVAIFGPAGTTFTPFIDLPWRINRLDATGAPFYNFSGNSITFGGVAPQINLSGGVVIPNALVFDAIVTLTNDQDLTLGTALSGFGGLDKAGPGRLTIATSTLYSGLTRVSAGTLRLGNGGAFPATIFAPIINNAALELAPGAPLALAGVSGTGSLTLLGGIVTSGAPFTYTGATHVLPVGMIAGQFTGGGPATIEGRLDAGDSTFASLAGTGQLSLLGGTVTIGGDNTTTVFTGPLVGVGIFSKVGSGRLTLAHALYHSGSTHIDAGTLRIGNGAAAPGAIFGPIVNNAAFEVFSPGTTTIPGLSGSGTLAVLGGILDSTAGSLAHTGATTVNGGGFLFGPIPNGGPLAIDAGGQVDSVAAVLASLSGAGALNFGTATVGSDNTSTAFTGPISGGPLQKTGSGRLTLAGPAVHSGATIIAAGAVRFGDGVTAPGFIGGIIFNDGALEFHATTGTLLNSGVSGTGTLTVLGGAVTIAGPLTHSGATVVGAGSLTASFQGFGSLAIAAGARVNASMSGVSSLTGAGVLDIDANGMLVGWAGASSTFGGVITGLAGVFKTGSGTLTLTGASTTPGVSGVGQGTLLVTGSISGPVQAVGGTLGGTGTLSGPVTVSAGATLAPGMSPGVINVGNLDLAGIALIEIEGTTLGTQYDNVNVTGTVTLAGATLSLAGAHVPAAGNSFTIVTNDGADAVTGTFAGLPEGATIALNGSALTISYVGGTGNDVVLSLAAAPGPGPGVAIPALSEWALLLLAAIMAGMGALVVGERGARRSTP